MRNRDSAMKSRERKKMYVKELEMKNKYLEAECRRLDYVFRCCTAENLALHQRLQKERLYDAPTAKQESAVLFVGKKHAQIVVSILFCLLCSVSAECIIAWLRLILMYGNALFAVFFLFFVKWKIHIYAYCMHWNTQMT